MANFGSVFRGARGRSAHPALVDDRAGIALEALAQRRDILVGDELAIAGVDLIGRERLQARRRRDVGARRIGAGAALLLLGEIPGEEELRRVGMRRLLEDAGG